MSRSDDVPDALVDILFLLIVVGLVYWAFASDKEEREEWRRFSADHHCRVTSKIDGQVFSTFSVGSDGKPAVGIGSTGEQYGWVCDDGITYFRSGLN